MTTRSLDEAEIGLLEKNGCSSGDWSRIRVAAGFVPAGGIRDSRFDGDVVLGVFSGTVRSLPGLETPSGIRRARLVDSTVGDNALVRDAELIGTDVGNGAVVDKVGRIAAAGPTAFGNGRPANVLAEHGGRSVPLWRRLSSQLAHLLCHLGGSPEAAKLREIIDADVERLSSNRSHIGARSRVERAGLLVNVRLEEGSSILGATELTDCHLAGSPEAPARVGEGVAARDAIFLAGSATSGGVRLERCLVGEGAALERGFSAEHSLFFANCGFAQGEAASAMCGPFAASHHKATLVLTCQTSFSTFGSMANASNNHYKIGPVHGGVLRRGAKPGSGSYLFWPADVGAFSTIVGRHPRNVDTADFPFSLLLGDGARSILVPAVNAFSAGVWRDERKWPGRDRRRGNCPLDLYSLPAMSPYVIQRMDRGAAILAEAAAKGGDLAIGGAVIPEERIGPGRILYDAAALFHTGRRWLEHVREKNGGDPPAPAELPAALSLPDDGESGEWRDWGGLLVSGGGAERFFADLLAGRFGSAEALEGRFSLLHEAYPEMEWRWLARRWRATRGEPNEETAMRFLREYRESILLRMERLKKDVLKEFSGGSRYGFGVERPGEVDFIQARGAPEDEPILLEMEKETQALLAEVDALLDRSGGGSGQDPIPIGDVKP